METSIIKLSNEYTKNTDKEILKKNGQYFTLDKYLLEQLLSKLEFNDNMSILEPSCGTGMVLNECLKKCDMPIQRVNVNFDCIEIDKNIYTKVLPIFKEYGSRINFINDDFLKIKLDKKYDLIIGNPPYFEINNKNIDSQFSEIMYGRTNIYSLFIYKCIKLLKDNGILSFIIPSTILSGKYFSKLREFIVKECNIIDIIKFDNVNLFSRALQSVIILKLQKTSFPDKNVNKFTDINKFTLTLNNNIFFVKNKDKLDFNNTTTINLLNCKVKTGNIVWNQKKEYLINKCQDCYPLIYATNIKNGVLSLRDNESNESDEKKQYMKYDHKYLETGPFILINRIIGNNPRKLNIYFEKNNTSYFIENHVNIISGSLDNLTKIYNSLNNEKTIVFIKEFICNTQLSQEELENILPIYN